MEHRDVKEVGCAERVGGGIETLILKGVLGKGCARIKDGRAQQTGSAGWVAKFKEE